jgi:hypothetical protein
MNVVIVVGSAVLLVMVTTGIYNLQSWKLTGVVSRAYT